MSSSFKPDKRAIEKIFKETQKEFDRQNRRNPITIPIHTDSQTSTLGSSARLDANTTSGLRCIMLLDWLYQMRLDQPALRQQTYDYVNSLGLDDEGEDSAREVLPWILDAITILEESGLIETQTGFGGARSATLKITDRGVRNSVERKERRSSLRIRTIACRRNLLCWIYESSAHPSDLGDILTTHYGNVEGDLFTVNEITEARNYLEMHGFINDESLTLTEDGRDCVENFGGVVSDHIARRQTGGTNFINNFNATVSSMQVAQGNRDVKQNQTVDGLDNQALVVLADALKEAAPALEGLSESGKAELGQAAEQLKAAAGEDEPNPQRLKGLLEWSKGALQEATGSALGTLLVAAVTSTLALLS